METYRAHVAGVEAIEQAFDKIINDRLSTRKKAKGMKKALRKQKKGENYVPPFMERLKAQFEKPDQTTIMRRALMYAIMMGWAIVSAGNAPSGPAFQMAISFGLCVYFLHDKRGGAAAFVVEKVDAKTERDGHLERGPARGVPGGDDRPPHHDGVHQRSAHDRRLVRLLELRLQSLHERRHVVLPLLLLPQRLLHPFRFFTRREAVVDDLIERLLDRLDARDVRAVRLHEVVSRVLNLLERRLVRYAESAVRVAFLRPVPYGRMLGWSS